MAEFRKVMKDMTRMCVKLDCCDCPLYMDMERI